MPVDRSRVRAPIDFRRGDRPPRVKDDCSWRSIETLDVGPASGLRSRGRSVSSIPVKMPATVPALGFASLRVVGHAHGSCRISWLCVLACGFVPAFASPASGERLSRSPIRSWALRRPSRLKSIYGGCRRNDFPPAGLLVVPARAPALQRVVGLMPGRSDVFRVTPDRLPV